MWYKFYLIPLSDFLGPLYLSYLDHKKDYTDITKIIDLKSIIIFLIDKNKKGYYIIKLTSESDKYEEILPDFKEILGNIILNKSDSRGEYIIPEFNTLIPESSDVSSSYGDNEIFEMIHAGIVKLDDNNNFRPDENITQKEFLLTVLTSISPNKKNDFEFWANKINFEHENFKSEKQITVAEALKIIFLIGTYYYANDKYDDIEIHENLENSKENSEWYTYYMRYARGSIIGVSDVNPNGLVTRGEMCSLIVRGILKLYKNIS